MKQLLFAALFALVMLLPPATVSAGPTPAQRGPAFDPAPCMFETPLTSAEALNIECGYVRVPLRHAEPAGSSIRLAVAILKSSAVVPEPDPLFMAQGGPGGSTIDTYAQLMATSPVREQRDIVLFDQRGTLYSEPALLCPESLELTIRTLDQRLDPQEEARLGLEASDTCRKRLLADNIDLSAFDSLENARDIDSIRAALGYDEVNLYGVSYGTLLALHAMREVPAALRSVILDAVVPTQTNFLLRAAQSESRALAELFAACASDPRCNRTYPNLEQVFFAQINRLDREPARMRLTDPETATTYAALLDGDDFRGAIFQLLYATEILPLLPMIIYDVGAGNYNLLEQLLPLLIFDRTMSEGMYLTVICAEDSDFSPSEQPTEGVRPEIATSSERELQNLLDICALWNVEPLDPTVDAPVESAIPTLLLSGRFDPITPPHYAEEAAQTLSNSYSFTLPNTGHGAFSSSPCAEQIVMDFLANPQMQPEAECLERLEGPRFLSEADVLKLPVMIRLLNLSGSAPQELTVFGGALVVLLSGLVVLPLIGLIKLVRRLAGAELPRLPAVALAMPWLTSLNALLLLAFPILFLALVFTGLDQYSTILLVGAPREWGSLFLIPPLSAVLTLLMLASLSLSWARGIWSLPGRLYYSLLTLAAIACVVVLLIWGMLGAVFM